MQKIHHYSISIFSLILVLASLILQFIVIFGNFKGLGNVYITRVEVDTGNSAGILSGLISSALSSIPNFISISLFKMCEGQTSGSIATVCSPSSFGYDFTSSDITLNAVQEAIPSWVHDLLSKVQKGVFILSVVLCFIFLVSLILTSRPSYLSKRRCCVSSLFFGFCALVFAWATFIFQIVLNQVLKSYMNEIKNSVMQNILGTLTADDITLNSKIGNSTWLSLVAAIYLLLVFVSLVIRMCCCRRSIQQKL